MNGDAGIPEMRLQDEIDDLCCIANTLNMSTVEVESAVMKHHGNHQEVMEVIQTMLACTQHFCLHADAKHAAMARCIPYLLGPGLHGLNLRKEWCSALLNSVHPAGAASQGIR